MKTYLKSLAILVMTVMISGATNDLHAQGSYVNSLISGMRDEGWELSENRTADLREGMSTTWYYRTFNTGLEYKVIALSEDDDVTDIDLVICYSDGQPYKSSVDESEIAEVSFQPAKDRYLKIKMTNYASDTPYYRSQCNYLIFYRY